MEKSKLLATLSQLIWINGEQRAKLVDLIQKESLSESAQERLFDLLSGLLSKQDQVTNNFYEQHPEMAKMANQKLQGILKHLNQDKENKDAEADKVTLAALETELQNI